jgi:DNA-binding transcriptional LysR family regulator
MFEELLQDSGLSLERLHTLSLMTETCGITEAAQGDANRQSQFSRQISDLEAFFGVELLNRASRPRRLTAAGQELAHIARQSLAALDDFRRRAANQSSRLVVGAGDSLIQWLLLPRFERLQVALPQASFVFKNLTTTATVQGLQSGSIDLGLVRQDALPESMEVAWKLKYQHHLFMPSALRSKLGKAAGLDALAKLPLAIMEGSGDLRQSLDQLALKHGLKLDVRLECSSFSQIALAVATGNFAGILPEFVRLHLATDSKSLDVHNELIPGLGRTVALAWSPAAAKLRPWVRVAALSLAKVLRT